MIIHNFNDSRFPQLNNDQCIAGINVPKGYVNATEMIKLNPKKKISHYMTNNTTKAYLEVISLETGIPVSNLVIVFKGLGSGKEASLQGTWVHPEVAIDMAGWLSPEFRYWANRTLRLVIEDKVKTIEFDDAQRNLQWEWLRTQSKLARRKFTDCLKDCIIKEMGEDFYNSPASAKVFSKYTAIAQASLTGFPSFNGNRDNCTDEQLNLLEEFEKSFVTKYEIDYPDESFDGIFDKVVKVIKRKFGL